MIKHIVMFKFKDENREENLIKTKKMLETLLDTVPMLKSMEVGINFSREARAMDLSLYSEFETKEDLEQYANHPKHLEVVKFIKSVAIESKVSDYRI